jgi:tetratricopeptide (TPR) repeat protein
MQARTAVALAAGLFVAGLGIGHADRKLDNALYHGKTSQDAARALLGAALTQAGDGSWERIAIGRVYYLGGLKSDGQAIFEQILSEDHDGSDELRIARVYCEAGEWPKAKLLFDHFVAGDPDDAEDLAEVGAYYLINGDRTHAEALFDRSFGADGELWATVDAAGGYLGVPPQE